MWACVHVLCMAFLGRVGSWVGEEIILDGFKLADSLGCVNEARAVC